MIFGSAAVAAVVLLCRRPAADAAADAADAVAVAVAVVVFVVCSTE